MAKNQSTILYNLYDLRMEKIYMESLWPVYFVLAECGTPLLWQVQMKLQTSSRFARGPFSHLRNPRRPRGGQEQSAGDRAPGRYCWLFCFLLPLTLSLESFGRKQVAWWRPTENFQPLVLVCFCFVSPGEVHNVSNGVLLLTKQSDLWGASELSAELWDVKSDQRLIKFHSHSEKLTRRGLLRESGAKVPRTTAGGSTGTLLSFYT